MAKGTLPGERLSSIDNLKTSEGSLSDAVRKSKAELSIKPEPKYIESGITHIQNIGDDGILSGQKAKPLQKAIEKCIPEAKAGTLPEKVYVETDRLNQIVRIEPLDTKLGLDYYATKEGNVGRTYEPIAKVNGKPIAFRDITQKVNKEFKGNVFSDTTSEGIGPVEYIIPKDAVP